MNALPSTALEVHRVPAVIVGSGVAGLSAALGLGHCLVVTRGCLGSGSSSHAQGGIAAALSAEDSALDHAQDTLAVAAEIADAQVVRTVTRAAADRIEWLIGLGARFDRGPDHHLSLGREAGHRARRVVHAHGDATGAEVMRVLTAAVGDRDDIAVLEGCELVDFVRAGCRVVGVLVLADDGVRHLVLAPHVVLATGGAGGLYARTTNPPEVRGDGIAIAARAGARLADLEFVQFHPTVLAVDSDPAPLLTEALRGEGAILVDECGHRFMPAVHVDAELAPRDVVARAIWQQLTAGHTVFLDSRAAIGDGFPEHFPSVWQAAQAAGFDPRREPLPVAPAEHYLMGGVVTDRHGRTSLPGLWAVGEVAATGLHGGNRLASNSLLEGLVLGACAAAAIRRTEVAAVDERLLTVPQGAMAATPTAEAGALMAVRHVMGEHVGLVRDADGLATALAELDALAAEFGERPGLEVRNLLTVARLVTQAALQRTESRGAHYRSDYPGKDPKQQHRSFVSPQAVASVALAIDSQPARRQRKAQAAA